jgi:hypothetical protein
VSLRWISTSIFFPVLISYAQSPKMLDFEGYVLATLSVRMNRFLPRVTFSSSSIFLGGTAAYHADTTPSPLLHACWLLKQVEDHRLPTSSVTPRARTDRPRLVPGVAHSRDLREVERHLSRETPMVLSLFLSLFLSLSIVLIQASLFTTLRKLVGSPRAARQPRLVHQPQESTFHFPLLP